MSKILESPFVQHPKPWWLPLLTLSMTLYGIIFLHWDLQPIVFLFWWEVILMVGSALIRMLFAFDSRPYMDQIGLKLMLLLSGGLLGGVFIMFSMVFTFKAFQEGGDYSGLGKIATQTQIMTAAYVLGLALHYFGNGRFREANPMGELMRVFVHLLVLLAFLQALTMHLIPKYPQLNQAVWVAVAVVALKFLVDLLFARAGKHLTLES